MRTLSLFDEERLSLPKAIALSIESLQHYGSFYQHWAIACFPWFLAAGIVQENIGVGKRILWWLGQSILLIGGFVLTLNFLPQLGFMFLLLPLFPPLMGILSLVAGLLNRAWVYTIGSALFFSWLMEAGFPLSA